MNEPANGLIAVAIAPGLIMATLLPPVSQGVASPDIRVSAGDGQSCGEPEHTISIHQAESSSEGWPSTAGFAARRVRNVRLNADEAGRHAFS
ncbi:hypothetical protein [Streptomyces sp. NPDC018833]|uniref:hypothetical protein n=1 Tax=Streptomyces sp. NPDC018833 TaxID=3365053 RepID=UPI00378B2BCB